MSEITYLPEVRCEVSEGLTGNDIAGRDQYIHVLPGWEELPPLH
jgi:hypothetical protein